MWHVKMFKGHEWVGTISFDNKCEAERWMDIQESVGIHCSLNISDDFCDCKKCESEKLL